MKTNKPEKGKTNKQKKGGNRKKRRKEEEQEKLIDAETYIHTHESHKSTKLEAIIYTKDLSQNKMT